MEDAVLHAVSPDAMPAPAELAQRQAKTHDMMANIDDVAMCSRRERASARRDFSRRRHSVRLSNRTI
ncbi:MAG: hypothetical protein EGP85_04350 [Bifidobacterium bifidum]|nr:hypothetical protein [Bifidobacterium bifidum]